MSNRRNGLREQVTEAKEGPLELRREKGKGGPPRGWGEGEGKGAGVLVGGHVFNNSFTEIECTNREIHPFKV